jgi:hypothetical protein
LVHAADSQTSFQPTPSYDPTLSRPSLVTDTSDPHFTSAEKLAQALQHSLAPPPPDSVTALSALTRQSVAAIVTAVQSHDSPNRPLAQASLENRIADSVVAIRHLLYISSPPYGHVPSHLYPRDGAVSSPSIPQALQVQLKPAQRRVTATLSKLFLLPLLHNMTQSRSRPRFQKGWRRTRRNLIVPWSPLSQKYKKLMVRCHTNPRGGCSPSSYPPMLDWG